jgi:hypothetical protein
MMQAQDKVAAVVAEAQIAWDVVAAAPLAYWLVCAMVAR